MPSLVTALEEKYQQVLQEVPGIFISGSPGRTSAGAILLPRVVCMDDRQVAWAGDEDRLYAMMKDVQELDLMKNELASWADVLIILRSCPALQTLNLGQNPLARAGPGPEWAIEELRCPNLRTLALNGTRLSWEQMLPFLHVFPNLEELHFGLNNHDYVPEATPDSFPSILRLYLNKNCLSHFSLLLRLSPIFPRLELLIVTDNGLEGVDSCLTEATAACGQEDRPHPFPNLSYLNIAENALCRWSCIEALRHLPSLVDLRLAGNPLFGERLSVKESRMPVIARLPNLQRLNGSAIGEEERIDAERAFIRQYMDQPEKPPRYDELSAKYGKLDPLADVDLRPKSVVTFVVRFNDISDMRAFNIDQSVGDLKRQVAAMFSCEPAAFDLFYLDTEVNWREHLRYFRRMVHSYRPCDGDELILISK